MTATRNDQKSLKSNLAEQGPSTHDSAVLVVAGNILVLLVWVFNALKKSV